MNPHGGPAIEFTVSEPGRRTGIRIRVELVGSVAWTVVSKIVSSSSKSMGVRVRRLCVKKVGGDLMCSFPCRKINAVCFPYLIIQLVIDFKKSLNNKLGSERI